MLQDYKLELALDANDKDYNYNIWQIEKDDKLIQDFKVTILLKKLEYF